MSMTIDESIEVLGTLLKRYDFIDDKEVHSATKLGIEALKRVNNPLQYNLTNPRVPLPGETEEP